MEQFFVSYDYLSADKVYTLCNKMPMMHKINSYCSLVHMENKGEFQRNPFPLNLAREDTRFLGKRPSSEDIDIASFIGCPPHKRNALE